ncbi:hypothetical protein [Microbacterium enclense]|uniref:hypothetical protein n=1 Tax=Microbacterium enclense TaxID=993073 RepID=UPI003F7E5E3E
MKTLIYEQVPSGFEVFAIGYTPLDSTVRACAILWSTAVRIYSAAGENFDSAYAAIADQVPANRRHAIQVMQEA